MKKKIYVAIILIYLYTPLLLIILYSFDDNLTMSTFNGFTLSNYSQLIHNKDLISAFINSLLIGFSSSTFSLVIGIIITFSIFTIRNKSVKKMFFSINNIMLISPDIVIGVSLLVMFTALNIKLGFYTVLLSHIIFSVPVVIITLYPKLKEIDENQIKAAYDLGATNKDIIFKILFPVLQSSILFSFLLVFMYSLDDFGVTYFVTGNGFSTLPILIYSMVKRGFGLDVNALFTVILFFIIIAVATYHFVYYKRKKSR